MPVFEQMLHDKVITLPRLGRPRGGKGTTNREIKYICGTCQQDVGRDHIFARQVTFINMVTKRKERTRTVDWVCDVCIKAHPDYDRERYAKSPGMKDITHA